MGRNKASMERKHYLVSTPSVVRVSVFQMFLMLTALTLSMLGKINHSKEHDKREMYISFPVDINNKNMLGC